MEPERREELRRNFGDHTIASDPRVVDDGGSVVRLKKLYEVAVEELNKQQQISGHFFTSQSVPTGCAIFGDFSNRRNLWTVQFSVTEKGFWRMSHGSQKGD